MCVCILRAVSRETNEYVNGVINSRKSLWKFVTRGLNEIEFRRNKRIVSLTHPLLLCKTLKTSIEHTLLIFGLFPSIFVLNFQKNFSIVQSRQVWLIKKKTRIELNSRVKFPFSIFNFSKLFPIEISRNLSISFARWWVVKISVFECFKVCKEGRREIYIFSRRGSFIYRHANLRAVSYSLVFPYLPAFPIRRGTRQKLPTHGNDVINIYEGIISVFSRRARGGGQGKLIKTIDKFAFSPHELLSSSLDSIVASSANSGYPDAS